MRTHRAVFHVDIIYGRWVHTYKVTQYYNTEYSNTKITASDKG
jgi:hypothetical protein